MDRKDLPIKWHIPDNLITRYSNNVVIQSNGAEFILSFFEVIPPILIGSPDDIQVNLEGVDSIPATCVARVVVSIAQVQAIIDTLQNNLNAFQNAQDSALTDEDKNDT